MSQNISPASRAHADAEAALKANTEAVATLKAQRAQLLEDEATARASLARGTSTPAVLKAITHNLTEAAALVAAIESLEAQRPGLARAVDQATGEKWAERVRALAPEGTYVARQVILDELAEAIRPAVEDARARAEALSAEAGALLGEAARLHRAGVLPRGASYSSTTGLKLDGVLIADAPTNSLGEKVGRALDVEAGEQRRAAAWARRSAA